jgi:hypothetical protein
MPFKSCRSCGAQVRLQDQSCWSCKAAGPTAFSLPPGGAPSTAKTQHQSNDELSTALMMYESALERSGDKLAGITAVTRAASMNLTTLTEETSRLLGLSVAEVVSLRHDIMGGG